MVMPIITCSKCLAVSSTLQRDMQTNEVLCDRCAEKLKQQGKRLVDVVHAHCDRAKEVADMLKEAKWNATCGYEAWAENEGKSLTWAEKHAEQEKRLEAYVKLRIEAATLI